MRQDCCRTFDVEYPDAKFFVEKCMQKFVTLPKTGKPTTTEWTILAGVVQYDSNTGTSKVVALGAGTKCLGKSALCPQGFSVNDSHAEVLARRALIRYIYNELRKEREPNCITKWDAASGRYKIASNISFHFVSTQIPCGDACIAAVEETNEGDEPEQKRRRINSDIGQLIYTGARLIGDDHKDRMQQTLNAIRTKPGRGERTLSMSCSDKLAKWNIVGWQGALLHALFNEFLYFSTLNFCCDSNEKALCRALNRWQTKPVHCVPKIRTCLDVDFAFKRDSHKKPSPNGLVWCDIGEDLKPYEVAVHGKRQGVTAKNQNSVHGALKISKYSLLSMFMTVLIERPELLSSLRLQKDRLSSMEYCEIKRLAKEYQAAWGVLRLRTLWPRKPEHLEKFKWLPINES